VIQIHQLDLHIPLSRFPSIDERRFCHFMTCWILIALSNFDTYIFNTPAFCFGTPGSNGFIVFTFGQNCLDTAVSSRISNCTCILCREISLAVLPRGPTAPCLLEAPSIILIPKTSRLGTISLSKCLSFTGVLGVIRLYIFSLLTWTFPGRTISSNSDYCLSLFSNWSSVLIRFYYLSARPGTYTFFFLHFVSIAHYWRLD
jgi:hypothetical protein